MPRLVRPVFIALLAAAPAGAQGIEEVPNPMAAHTIFIVAITSAFLIWAVSFSLQTTKERADKNKQRQMFLAERERILDSIADLEADRDSGKIDSGQYKSRIKKLRGELTRVIERLRPTSRAKKKPVR